jgi:hypothetical protein
VLQATPRTHLFGPNRLQGERRSHEKASILLCIFDVDRVLRNRGAAAESAVDVLVRIAQIAKMTEDAAKGASGKKGAAAGGPMDQIRAITDFAKTRDYLTRDLVSGFAPGMPPAGTLPWVRYVFAKVKPGKGGEYRKAWEKYNKPVLDKLAVDGTILAFGLAVEDVRTDGDFTHYTWIATKDLASQDKVRAAFLADRDKRSQEEQEAITHLFASLTDPDAARSELTRSVIFHLPNPK